MNNKRLMLVPLVSSVLVILITALISLPIILFFGTADVNTDSTGGTILGFIGGFILYLIIYTVIIYFGCVLTAMVLKELEGVNASFSYGMSVANAKLGKIVQYAAVASTVGMILSYLKEKAGILGKVISFGGGVAWNVATFLVIPVLVVKDVGPLDAVKESASLLKKSFGEQVIGYSGIGIVTGLISIPIFLLGFLLFFGALTSGSVALIVLSIALLILFIAIVSLFSSALNSIYRTMLYKFASEGVIPVGLDENTVKATFKTKA